MISLAQLAGRVLVIWGVATRGVTRHNLVWSNSTYCCLGEESSSVRLKSDHKFVTATAASGIGQAITATASSQRHQVATSKLRPTPLQPDGEMPFRNIWHVSYLTTAENVRSQLNWGCCASHEDRPMALWWYLRDGEGVSVVGRRSGMS